MRRSRRSGQTVSHNASPGPLPDASPYDEAIRLLGEIKPIDGVILSSLRTAAAAGVTVRRGNLQTRLASLGHLASDYELGGRLNLLRRLGVVAVLDDESIDLASPLPVLGTIS